MNRSWRYFFIVLLIIFPTSLQAASSKLHLDVGLNHFYKKRYLEAYKEFKRAIEREPNNAEAHFNLGRVYKIQGFIKEALVEFQVALSINPNYLTARREFEALKQRLQGDVQLQLKIKGREEARRIKNEATEPDSALLQGQELLRQGNRTQALLAFEEAVRKDPYNPKLFKLIGFLYFQSNGYSKSLASYEKASKLAPDDAEVYYAIGLIHLRTKNFAQAVIALKRAIQLAKRMTKAQFALGEVYERLGRLEDASFQFRKSLELDPNLRQAKAKIQRLGERLSYNYFTRGSNFYQQGNYDQAQALLSLARQYGALTDAQRRQADEMIGASNYWINKRRAEEKVKSARKEVRDTSYINKQIRVEDVTLNPHSYLGQSVEWSGSAAFIDKFRGKITFFVNTNPMVDTDSNMRYTFGIVFPRALPEDPRVSIYSTVVTVKGKIIKMQKIFNPKSSVQSSRRQPILEATEISFQRDNYEQPLVIRYY